MHLRKPINVFDFHFQQTILPVLQVPKPGSFYKSSVPVDSHHIFNTIFTCLVNIQGCHVTGKTGNLDAHFSRQGKHIFLKILKTCFYTGNLLPT